MSPSVQQRPSIMASQYRRPIIRAIWAFTVMESQNNGQNPLVHVRWPNNSFIHTIGFPKLVRWHLYIETGPCDRGLFQYKDVLLPACPCPSRSSLSWGTGLPVGSHSSQSTPAPPLPVAPLYNPPYTVPTLSLSHSIIQSTLPQHPQHNSHR